MTGDEIRHRGHGLIMRLVTDYGIVGVVVARERVEGAELKPPQAQRRGRVTVEPANVGPHQRDAEQVEVQHISRGIEILDVQLMRENDTIRNFVNYF